jgi:hypothetical protein
VQVLSLRVLDRGICVRCQEPCSQALITVAYGPMQGDPGLPDLDYIVGRNGASAAFLIKRAGRELLTAPDDGTFLALLDEDVAIELQKLRADLYFIHAAVLKRADAAVMLVAQSGGGKSTLCWALLHHGFRYLSDELGPVDLETLNVYPFPRALVLKAGPPTAYPLPPKTVRTSRTLHVTAADIPGGIIRGPVPLSTVFFLTYDPDAPAPSVRRLSSGEAAARLYANALNPLAHAGEGLDGAIRLATKSRCFELTTAELAPTCALLTATMERSL